MGFWAAETIDFFDIGLKPANTLKRLFWLALSRWKVVLVLSHPTKAVKFKHLNLRQVRLAQNRFLIFEASSSFMQTQCGRRNADYLKAPGNPREAGADRFLAWRQAPTGLRKNPSRVIEPWITRKTPRLGVVGCSHAQYSIMNGKFYRLKRNNKIYETEK